MQIDTDTVSNQCPKAIYDFFSNFLKMGEIKIEKSK